MISKFGYVADYGGKSVKRRRFSANEILILPKGLSEFTDKTMKISGESGEQLPAYEIEARAIREKTERLKALRLARDAADKMEEVN